MSELNIISCNNWQEWDNYVLNHSNGTLYHLSSWKNAIEKTFSIHARYFIALENQKICGILPLFRIRTLQFSWKIISIPFAVYGGILADHKKIEKLLQEYAIKYASETLTRHLEFRFLHDPGYDLPKQELYITFIKEIEASYEKILSAVPRKSRASIRNGYKKFDLSANVNYDIKTLYHLYLLNKRKLGSPPFPYRFFKNLLDEFGNKANILTVYYQKKPAASVLFFEYKDTLLPYFSGADSRFNYTNANNVLYYELMKYGLDKKFKYFDFGRSRKQTGSAKFKENMGFIPKPLNYYHYLANGAEIPNINPSNQKFNFISNIWSHLPLKLTEYLGPIIVKRLP